jgi:hypothetical protein
MQHISEPVAALMARLEKSRADRRASPTYRKPKLLTLYDLSGRLEFLAQFEIEAEREQLR